MKHPQSEEELERIIAALVARRHAAAEGSASRRAAERQLQGLRYTYDGAGGIIEELETELSQDYGYSIRINPTP
jgi:hypothetical protein